VTIKPAPSVGTVAIFTADTDNNHDDDSDCFVIQNLGGTAHVVTIQDILFAHFHYAIHVKPLNTEDEDSSLDLSVIRCDFDNCHRGVSCSTAGSGSKAHGFMMDGLDIDLCSFTEIISENTPSGNYEREGRGIFVAARFDGIVIADCDFNDIESIANQVGSSLV
jgi:hypothetical protein